MTQWSTYQENIFDWAVNGQGNGIIKAVAGSGKSTTIVEVNRRVKDGRKVFLAFNKSIATELKDRGVNGKTFHGLCFGPVSDFIGSSAVEQNKTFKIFKQIAENEELRIYGSFVTKIVGLAKNLGVGTYILPDEERVWREIAADYDLEPSSDSGTIQRGIELAREVFELSNKADIFDFDDMLYFVVKYDIALPKFDLVLVDEAQDLNAIQIEIVKRIMTPKARMIAVGDPRQAIYAFRGAGSDSLDIIQQEFNCKELPLTISYRCPQAVIRHAQQWVPYIEAAPGAKEGEVVNLGFDWTNAIFQANDLIVSRKTAPLLKLAYGMLADRIPCYVMGRDIGEGLKTLINKQKTNNTVVLLEKLNAWLRLETEKALKDGNDHKIQSANDKVDCIKVILDSMAVDVSVNDLLDTIDKLFAEKTNCVVLSTIHRSKGLEAWRVIWVNSTENMSWITNPVQLQQEDNLRYVATTRAKNALALIEVD